MSGPSDPVVIVNAWAREPVFHAEPWWVLDRSGWRGTVLTVNRYKGGGGVEMPEYVVSPCGQVRLRYRVGLPPTLHSIGPRAFLDDRGGPRLPLRHAEKFARPCRRCFPEDDRA